MSTYKNNDKCKIEFVNGSSIEISSYEEELGEKVGWTIVCVGGGIFCSKNGTQIYEMT